MSELYFIFLRTKNMTEKQSTTENSNNQGGISSRDLLIPVSIIVAGLFVGVGLYFGSSPSMSENLPVNSGDNTPPVAGTVLGAVEDAGVDKVKYQECFESDRKRGAVTEDLNNAVDTGGQGTPWSILIGPSGKKYPINGALPEQAIVQAIELAKSESDQGPGSSEAELALENVDPVSASDHIRGNPDAEIVIVEYSDFDCPFCARFHSTMNSVMDQYGEEVAWVYRHFPLESLHPNAPAVAVASECVAELGGNDAFWKFADSYFGS